MIAQDNNLTGKDSAVNGADDREAHPKFWIAAYTKSRSEKKAAIGLWKEGIETYVPVQTIERQWTDRKKRIEVPVIPLIIFAKVSQAEVLKVKKNPYIVRVLSYPGSRDATAIPEDQIDNLRLMLTKAQTPVKFTPNPPKLYDSVRVIKGNLEGLVGRVERIDGNKARLIVSIDLLGGAIVEIESDYLDIIN